MYNIAIQYTLIYCVHIFKCVTVLEHLFMDQSSVSFSRPLTPLSIYRYTVYSMYTVHCTVHKYVETSIFPRDMTYVQNIQTSLLPLLTLIYIYNLYILSTLPSHLLHTLSLTLSLYLHRLQNGKTNGRVQIRLMV